MFFGRLEQLNVWGALTRAAERLSALAGDPQPVVELCISVARWAVVVPTQNAPDSLDLP